MIPNDTKWQEAHSFEQEWWGDCTNTSGEELKQLEYAKRMGLRVLTTDSKSFFDLEGKSILDIGGGPVSLLLKCVNKGRAMVLDPLSVPDWCESRYRVAGIEYIEQPAEKQIIVTSLFDEIWLYNVLQHAQDPKQIIEIAKKIGKLIRIFEWIETEPHPGHPQKLTEKDLNEWLGGIGFVYTMDKEKDKWGQYPLAYYGVFPTANYGKVEIQ